jgi:cysteine desulfurase/selenocysteine lyase
MTDDLRSQFPALNQEVHGRRLTYLDNAATMQRPQRVLDAMDAFYVHDNANINRSAHELSRRATEAYEAARQTIQSFVNAEHKEEIIFTKGCTEALNLVAQSWGRANLKAGDLILLSLMEHHASIVPWQLIAQEKGATVKPIPITDRGEIDLEAYDNLLRENPKVVGIKHICNTLGTINPIKNLAEKAHEAGAIFVADGAQGLAHGSVDVQDFGVDFYAMAPHKTYGPMGVGALYGKRQLLENMPPWQGGGDMIRVVSFEGTTFREIPNRFEAGTPNPPGAVGFGEAIRFIQETGLDKIAAFENDLRQEMEGELTQIPGLKIHGQAETKAALVSFTIDGIHPHDLGTILDRHGVAVRTGHHCCMPLMRRLGLPATVRASLALYNTKQDIKVLIEALHAARKIFA